MPRRSAAIHSPSPQRGGMTDGPLVAELRRLWKALGVPGTYIRDESEARMAITLLKGKLNDRRRRAVPNG